MALRNFRPVAAALVALLFYTITDILVWQRVFETHRMFEFASTYHTGWFVSLAVLAMVYILLYFWRIRQQPGFQQESSGPDLSATSSK